MFNTGNRQHDRDGAQSGNHSLITLSPELLSCGTGFITDCNRVTLDLCNQPTLVGGKGGLKRSKIREIQLTAQLIGAFKQRYGMSAMGEGERCHHASGSAADNGYTLWNRNRLLRQQILLNAQSRIH